MTMARVLVLATALMIARAVVAGPSPSMGLARPAATATPFPTFTFTVDSTGDGSDNNLSDISCDDGTGACTLRAAIEQANSLVSGSQQFTDKIFFSIAGSGPHTIRPASALPTITDPVLIDGYTQPGASPNTNGPGLGLNTVLMIELDGTNALPLAEPGVIGLHLEGGNSTVQGLVINRFSGSRIYMANNGGNIVKGNFIGTDVNGGTDLGNNGDGVGIGVASANNVIGGTDPRGGQRYLRQSKRCRHLRLRRDGELSPGQLHRHGRHRDHPSG